MSAQTSYLATVAEEEVTGVRRKIPARSYRARDLLLVPNLLSAARIPLAVAFPFVVHRPVWAIAVLATAALTDMMDGYAARKLKQATPVGALVDGVADKLFAISVVLSLVFGHVISPVFALLLATREIGELPLALRILGSRDTRLAELDRGANKFGKLATVLEFGTVLAVLFAMPHVTWLLGATAVVGALAAITYWVREIQASTRMSKLLSSACLTNARMRVRQRCRI